MNYVWLYSLVFPVHERKWFISMCPLALNWAQGTEKKIYFLISDLYKNCNLLHLLLTPISLNLTETHCICKLDLGMVLWNRLYLNKCSIFWNIGGTPRQRWWKRTWESDNKILANKNNKYLYISNLYIKKLELFGKLDDFFFIKTKKPKRELDSVGRGIGIDKHL